MKMTLEPKRRCRCRCRHGQKVKGIGGEWVEISHSVSPDPKVIMYLYIRLVWSKEIVLVIEARHSKARHGMGMGFGARTIQKMPNAKH